MRRIALSLALALTLATVAASCGGSTPNTPTPTPGGGGNGGGGVTPTPNTPPTVKSVTASDTRVEVGSPVTLTANVEDLETPVDNLTYGWTFPATGSASATGSGRVITWTPSADLKTPADLEITVTVTERVTSSGGIQVENKATGTITLHVNNSPKELAELSLRFLGDFANSKITPDKCVGEFTDSTAACARGKKDELADVDDNRHDYEHVRSTLRHTGLSIAPDRLSATVHTFCSFTVRVISTEPRDEVCEGGKKCPLGSEGTSTGDCWTTNVYEKGRWWLCESHFTSQGALTAPTSFIPTLFRRTGR